MTMPRTLFSPFKLRKLALANRIVVSPMCQYSAVDGCATDWHIAHWGQLLQSSAGMCTIEATAATMAPATAYAATVASAIDESEMTSHSIATLL